MALTDEKIIKLPFDLYCEGFRHYSQTRPHRNSIFKYTLGSLLALMSFGAATNIDLINQPLLTVAGSQAGTLYMTQETFEKATTSKKKSCI